MNYHVNYSYVSFHIYSGSRTTSSDPENDDEQGFLVFLCMMNNLSTVLLTK